ncbi:hypothetical protein BT63DRAFT_448583 [Microthyrium microscopicum]|uniref:Uncharacterized protein n=1 Tax=Microthyrium microscopicum TaxID=703497 RepID=A0A6A6TZN1_9PEZI|nr:hypothetical protein BT63DRAFT_448583 [Microthyrium microscopicum]
MRVAGQLTSGSLQSYPNALALEYAFNPVIPSYWTNLPHHRRTPFALSPDGKSAFLAYLDQSGRGVHIQQVDTKTFTATGTAVTVAGGKEAGGLVAHNDGFALLTNEAMPSGTSNPPPGNTPVPVLYRFKDGKQSWKTWLGGPDVHPREGLSMAPDLNGDLAYSEKSGLYGAYFVITNYAGSAKGHFGDSIQYVTNEGKIQTIRGASSSWGCSHNTGIAIAAADTPPYASACAEDHTGIWLNTKTQSMNGQKISNEHVINGATNSAMGGTSGSYSLLSRFPTTPRYIFTWISRGAVQLTANAWLTGQTTAKQRWPNRHVAIALLSSKETLAGPQATSKVGSASGDDQVNWLTTGSNDHSNAHVAAFDANSALVSWEEMENPSCKDDAMDCSGNFVGTSWQLVDGSGKKVGGVVSAKNVTVSGDVVLMPDGRLCWPYVDMAWSLKGDGARMRSAAKKMSFGCMKKS